MPKFTIHPPTGSPITVEAPTREAALDQALDASGGPDVTALGSFGRGAAGMIPLGEQAYSGVAGLAEHKPYLQERNELDQEIAADKATNPGARLAGQAAGVVAPIVATAGLAAPESLLGAAGQGALFGGAFGGGKAIDTLAGGGSGTQAAGDVALGAGLGAVGGAAGEGLTNALGKLAGATLPAGDELSAGAVARALGTNTRQLNRMGGKNPVETLNALKPTLMESEVNGQPLVKTFDQMPDKLDKMIELQKQSGARIGSTIRDAGVEPMDVGSLTQQLSGAKKFPSPPETAQLNSVIERIKQYADANGKMPFESLQKLKTDLGHDAFHGQGDPILQHAYSVVNDAQNAELDRVGSVINKPDFDLAKKQYRLASLAVPMLKMRVSKELANRTSLTVPGAALATGHPLAAGLALAKPRLEEIANNAALQLGQNFPQAAGNAIQRVGSMSGAAAANEQVPEAKSPTDIPLNHPALAPWRKYFAPERPAHMADGGMVAPQQPLDAAEAEKHNAVTDFTLSQRDPAYAAAKQKAIDEQENGSAEHKPQNMANGGMVTPTGFPEPQETDNMGLKDATATDFLLPMMGMPGAGKAATIGADALKLGEKEAPALSNLEKWFGNSKVVNAEGKPQVVYHGSVKDFNQFSNKATPNSTAGQSWISSDPEVAETFGGGMEGVGKAGKNIKPLYAAMKNPAGPEELKKYGADGLAKQGYDGVMIPNKNGTFDGFVLDGKQLKSATGNSGAYDPSNADITMASGGLVAQAKDKLASMGPVEGFGSTLQGFQNMVTPQKPTHVATQAASVPMEQPFNSQMEEQLKAFMLDAKKPSDEE